MSATVTDFGSTAEGIPVERVRITADGISADVLTLGATLHRLQVAGRNVILGHPDVAGYQGSPFYAGATCGRVANRLDGARIELDGRVHALPANEKGNTLHGGPVGFSQRVWTIDNLTESAVVLLLTSEDGDQGFPGRVVARASFEAIAGQLSVVYTATTDAATPINLTTHPYFNLNGEDAGSTDDHLLAISSDRVLETRDDLVPTGRFLPAAPVGRVGDLAPLDHCFAISGEGLRLAARLEVPDLALAVWTDQPGLQVYSGDALNTEVIGTSGQGYVSRAGLALEAQNFPDAPNQPHFPSALLRPGERYSATTSWRFTQPKA